MVSVSLSARRAWIEISTVIVILRKRSVALRKESVDRNNVSTDNHIRIRVALRKESVDRNNAVQVVVVIVYGRSPQGERG